MWFLMKGRKNIKNKMKNLRDEITKTIGVIAPDDPDRPMQNLIFYKICNIRDIPVAMR